jgi:hypothetical protein
LADPQKLCFNIFDEFFDDFNFKILNSQKTQNTQNILGRKKYILLKTQNIKKPNTQNKNPLPKYLYKLRSIINYFILNFVFQN